MPSKSKLAGLLADRLDRLRTALAALRRSVRDRVAEIVGAAVAEAARDAVRLALDPPAPPAPHAPPPAVGRRGAYDPWGVPERDEWADEYDPIGDGGEDAWGY